MRKTTLKELGLVFDKKSGCNVCDEKICMFNATCNETYKDVYMCIIKSQTNEFSVIEIINQDDFLQLSNEFKTETDVTYFIDKNYSNFKKCF